MLLIEQIRTELFDIERNARVVCAQYGLDPALRGAALETAMWETLGQAPRAEPDRQPSNKEVFHAAVLALASNMRAWSTVLRAMPELERACSGFDPASTALAGQDAVHNLAKVLSGQSGKGDQAAVLKWARLLSVESSFGQYLAALQRQCEEAVGDSISLTDPLRTAIVAGVIGFDIHLPHHPASAFGFPSKAPGMGGPLASEFLRNLGWSGFKPDRHIMRLFKGWVESEPEWSAPSQQADEDSRIIERALKVRRVDFRRFLCFSRLGELVTPAGMPVTRADQLVWLYGSIVRKKRRKRTDATPERASP